MPSLFPFDYSQYNVNDFVLDDFFRQWVLQPGEETVHFWHDYLLNHPHQRADIDQASSVLLHLSARHDDLTHASRERIWQVLETAFDRQHWHQRPPDSAHPYLQTNRFRYWWMAASLAGAFLLAGSGWYIWQQGQPLRVHTDYGTQMTLTLPDGSRVRLNGNSTLRYAGSWQASEDREVWLDGEAFFEVTKQQTTARRIKFITHTPDLSISVLGTRFNVNTRRGNTQVVLTEGRVELSKPGDPKARRIVMQPGQLALTQPGIEQVVVRPTRPNVLTAWTKNQFVFDNTSLRDIARQLEDTQGIRLIFEDDAMADRRFTGNLANENTETLLTTLATTFNLKIDRFDTRIYLRRQ